MDQKYNKLIFFIGVIFLISLLVFGINAYKKEKAADQSEVAGQSEVIDILSLPGWERLGTADLKATVKYDKDDGIWQITNPDSYLYVVDNNKISLKAEKPFEVRAKIETRGMSHTENIQLGFVRLYNSQEQSWLEVGLGVDDQFVDDPFLNFNYLYFNLVDLTKPEKERFQPIIQRNEKIIVPQGIVLGIKVEDDNNDLGEKITIYDCGTGEIFKQTNLPYEFFKDKIFFGFESGNMTNDPQGVQMEIGQFSVLFPGRDAMTNLIFE